MQMLEAKFEELKREYVFMLQSCVQIPLNENSWDIIHVCIKIKIKMETSANERTN